MFLKGQKNIMPKYLEYYTARSQTANKAYTRWVINLVACVQ